MGSLVQRKKARQRNIQRKLAGTEKARQRNTDREIQRNIPEKGRGQTEEYREMQRNTEKDREIQRNTEKYREGQRKTDREIQRWRLHTGRCQPAEPSVERARMHQSGLGWAGLGWALVKTE